MLSTYDDYRYSEFRIFIDRPSAIILTVLFSNDGSAPELFTSTECVLPTWSNTGTIFPNSYHWVTSSTKNVILKNILAIRSIFYGG